MSITIVKQCKFVTATATFPCDSEIFDHDRNLRSGIFTLEGFALEVPIIKFVGNGRTISVTFTCRKHELEKLASLAS